MPGLRSSAARPGWTRTVPLVEPRSVAMADPWSAPAPGRISRWVEEISWLGLGDRHRRGAGRARRTGGPRARGRPAPCGRRRPRRRSRRPARRRAARPRRARSPGRGSGGRSKSAAGAPTCGLAVVVGPRRRRRPPGSPRSASGRPRARRSSAAAASGSGLPGLGLGLGHRARARAPNGSGSARDRLLEDRLGLGSARARDDGGRGLVGAAPRPPRPRTAARRPNSTTETRRQAGGEDVLGGAVAGRGSPGRWSRR